MEFLSSGEKIRKIRNTFKFSQREVAGNSITRELLSLIEHNKTPLSSSAAKAICNNINDLCKEKNIDFTLDVNYVLKGIDAEAYEVASEYLDTLCKFEINTPENIMEYINKIDSFIASYDVKELKLLIYEKIGDIFKSQKDYTNSYLYYIKAYESRIQASNKASICALLQKLGSICISLSKDSDAIHFNNLALLYAHNVNHELKYKIYFNNMLAYIHLKDYSNGLHTYADAIENIENIPSNKLLKLNMLKANCLRHEKLFTEALKINETMLKTLNKNNLSKENLDNVILSTNNILDIYTVLKDTSNVEVYCKRMINIVEENKSFNNSYQSSNSYNQLGQSYVLLSDYPKAVYFFKKSIDACKKFKNSTILIKSLNHLLDILIFTKDTEEINLFKNHLLELIYLNLIEPSNLLILKLISFFSKEEDYVSLNNMVDFILEIKNPKV